MLLDYNRIDPELLPGLETFPALDLNRENISKMRDLLAARPQPSSSVDVLSDRKTIDTEDGTVDVYIYRKNDQPDQPAVLWIHGGGYILGNAVDERARIIADHCNCTVFSVDYRLAPEHPFPAGPNDCYATLAWIMNDAKALGIDKNRVAMGGASAGSGMAAGVALMNRDRDNFPLQLQLLLYPMIDNLHATGSGKLENHPVWKQSTSFNAWEMYLDGVPGEQASPYAAATRATDLTGLPPAYICVGSEDLFRDENIDYAQRLIAAGVPCEFSIFPGLYHGADSFIPTARVSRRLNQAFLRALDHALNPQPV
jgi:acetyl esterase/lipase